MNPYERGVGSLYRWRPSSRPRVLKLTTLTLFSCALDSAQHNCRMLPYKEDALRVPEDEATKMRAVMSLTKSHWRNPCCAGMTTEQTGRGAKKNSRRVLCTILATGK